MKTRTVLSIAALAALAALRTNAGDVTSFNELPDFATWEAGSRRDRVKNLQ